MSKQCNKFVLKITFYGVRHKLIGFFDVWFLLMIKI